MPGSVHRTSRARSKLRVTCSKAGCSGACMSSATTRCTRFAEETKPLMSFTGSTLGMRRGNTSRQSSSSTRGIDSRVQVVTGNGDIGPQLDPAPQQRQRALLTTILVLDQCQHVHRVEV